MGKLTVVVPNKVNGKVYDYDEPYDELKKKLRGWEAEVEFEDKNLYADDVVALTEDKIEARIALVVQKRLGALLKGVTADLFKVDGLAKQVALDTYKASLHFPNRDLAKIDFEVVLKAPKPSDPAKRKPRAGKTEIKEYKIDRQGLDIEEQLRRKIKDLALLGPDGRHGGKETVQGVSVHHHTIPSANMTVFYAWDGDTMTLYGVGGHSGKDGSNDQYDVTWYDGRRFTWSR